jgi:hypothetical protein
MTRERIACCLLLALLVATPATGAEVRTWSADAPFAGGPLITIDFGAELADITSLEAVVTGMGGAQDWVIYQGMGNPTGSVPFAMTLDGGDGGAVVSGDWMPILEPFSHDLLFAPVGDWAFLEDGVMTLGVSYVHAPLPQYPMCYATGYTLPVIDHLELIVTFGAAVPVEVGSWGGVKALFR